LWEYDVHNLSFDPIGEGVNGFSVEPAVDVPEKTNFTSPTNSWRTDNSQFNSPAHRVTWIQNPVGPGILPGDTGRFSFTTLPRQPQLVAGVPNPVLSGVGNHGFAVDPTSRIICCRITGDLVVPSTPSQVIPVILIPGILGTSLYNGNDLLWVDLVEACLLPNHDIPDLQLLALAATGTSAAGIHTGSILDGTVGGLLSFKINFYGGLENALSQAGYQQNRLLFPFPYDWRLDNAGNADLLETFIENTVLPVSGSSTVDIVAHSMGGLLVRRYAERYGTARVDKVIYLGTPHTGAAKAFGPLAFNNALNGFLGYPCINNGTLAALSRTFPSAFELLPRSPFIFSNALQRTLTLDESYKQPPDGFGFLVSSRWVDAANAFHQSIAVTANMAQYVIVGSGFPTLAGFTLQTNPSSTPRRLCAESGDGDNTVPTSSSTAFGFLNTFYVKRVKHDELPNNGIVQKLVLDILANNLMSLPQDVSRDPFTPTGTLNFCTGSPVSVSISDVRSSQDGIGSDGETRTDIDGSEFVVFESNQTGFVESNQPYQFTLTGTAIGVFSLTIQQKDENGTVLGSIQFTDIPVSAHSVGTFTLVPNDFSPVLSVDVDGNGTVDVVFATNQPPPPTASVAALRLIVQGLGLDKGITTSLRAKLDAALAGLATGRMTDVRGNLTAFKNEVQAQAGKAITSVDAQGLVNIVDHILAIR
jgi:pimeloyl-ACP methyl ester carboxylesterase